MRGCAAQAEPEPGVLAGAEGARGRGAFARAPGTPLAPEPTARARHAPILRRAVRSHIPARSSTHFT